MITIISRIRLLENPFEKFERKRFLNYCKDLSEIGINNALWKKLGEEDLRRVKEQMEGDLRGYYKDRVGVELPKGASDYFRNG